MLTLPIKKVWFDMIQSGIKKEEYREISPYYTSRFKNAFPAGVLKQFICFRNGYSKKSPEFVALCSLDVKNGKEEWGATPNKKYYVLTIHKIKNEVDTK